MFNLKKIFTVNNIVFFVVAWWLYDNFFREAISISLGEGFCGCMEPEVAECDEAAKMASGLTKDRLAGCWLPRYQQCQVSCPNGAQNCKCHTYASQYCGDVECDAAKVFVDTHRSCMASKGLGSSC